MAKMDIDLGQQVHKHLTSLGIETPMLGSQHEHIDQIIQRGMHDTMRALGLDLSDDSLRETPARVAKMFTHEIFWGLNYENFPAGTVISNKMKYDEMVAVRCTVKSVCEHHFVPFIGIAHCAYIPNTKVLGLSKFNRITQFFCRRPQVQERLTVQIQKTLQYMLDTLDVAVVVRAQHYCVHLRGVEDSNAETTTSAMGGKFMTVPSLREEFLALTRGL